MSKSTSNRPTHIHMPIIWCVAITCVRIQKKKRKKNLLCMQAHRYTYIGLAVAFFCLFCLSSVRWFCSVMVHCFANTATISHRNWFNAQNLIYFFFFLASQWKFPLDSIETPWFESRNQLISLGNNNIWTILLKNVTKISQKQTNSRS